MSSPNLADMLLRLPQRNISFPRRPLVMGILNINDDSFSGDGKVDVQWAMARTKNMIREGADIIDVGAESARTNRQPIPVEEEIYRLLPFLDAWPELLVGTNPRDDMQVFPPVLSVNTWRPEVAAAVLPHGVELLNDMGGLPDDRNAKLCLRHRCSLLLMHTSGLPKESHEHVRYRDVVTEVEEFFLQKLVVTRQAGLSPEAIVLDLGLGFAKQWQDDLRLLANLERLTAIGRPFLLPISRKGFIGRVLGVQDPQLRDAGTIGTLVSATLRGASIFRVHEVNAAWLAVKTLTNHLFPSGARAADG